MNNSTNTPAAPMTEQELAEIEARADAATPGPWEIIDDGDNQPWIRASGFLILDLATLDVVHHAQTVGAFMVNAPTDVHRLVAEVRRLREQRDAARRVERGAVADWIESLEKSLGTAARVLADAIRANAHRGS